MFPEKEESLLKKKETVERPETALLEYGERNERFLSSNRPSLIKRCFSFGGKCNILSFLLASASSETRENHTVAFRRRHSAFYKTLISMT